LPFLQDAIGWAHGRVGAGKIAAFGVDTLTAWARGIYGDRPADAYLRNTYPDVSRSVIWPNALRSSMSVNGGAFLVEMGAVRLADRPMVTEAHPRVCYYAMTRNPLARGGASLVALGRWLTGQLGLGTQQPWIPSTDHEVDAALALLATVASVKSSAGVG
jgi:hypothetical protein